MEIRTSEYTYTAFDGKVLLRTDIDKPSETVCKRTEYLTALSNACEQFAQQKLYLRLTEAYKNLYGSNSRFLPYNYKFKIIETYCDDVYLSVLITVSLRRSGDILFLKYKSVIFKGDQILPPRFITKQPKSVQSLIINDKGLPAHISFENGKIKYTMPKKYNFPI